MSPAQPGAGGLVAWCSRGGQARVPVALVSSSSGVRSTVPSRRLPQARGRRRRRFGPGRVSAALLAADRRCCCAGGRHTPEWWKLVCSAHLAIQASNSSSSWRLASPGRQTEADRCRCSVRKPGCWSRSPAAPARTPIQWISPPEPAGAGSSQTWPHPRHRRTVDNQWPSAAAWASASIRWLLGGLSIRRPGSGAPRRVSPESPVAHPSRTEPGPGAQSTATRRGSSPMLRPADGAHQPVGGARCSGCRQCR